MTRSLLPAWLWCFLATLVVYLLQLYRPTGLFLMMVAAPFWSVVFINLGFMLLAWDAWTGRAPRSMLAPPLLWFGGYAIATGFSHWQAHRFFAVIDAANRGQQVAWSIADNDVLVTGEGLDAQQLVERHGLARVYTRRRVGNDGQEGRVVALVRYCPAPAVQQRSDGTTVIYLHASVQGRDVPGRLRVASDVCTMSADGSPQRPAVTVTLSPPSETTSRLANTRVRPVTIRTPDGRVSHFRSAEAGPLAWWPEPILGCALNSAAPRWECFAGFGRGRADADGMRSAQAVTVAALRLPTLTLEQRFPDAVWR